MLLSQSTSVDLYSCLSLPHFCEAMKNWDVNFIPNTSQFWIFDEMYVYLRQFSFLSSLTFSSYLTFFLLVISITATLFKHSVLREKENRMREYKYHEVMKNSISAHTFHTVCFSTQKIFKKFLYFFYEVNDLRLKRKFLCGGF